MFAVGVSAPFGMIVAWAMGGDVALVVAIGVAISVYWLIGRKST